MRDSGPYVFDRLKRFYYCRRQTRGSRIWRLADARGGVQFQKLPVWTWFPSAAAFFGRNLSRLATSEPVWLVSGCYGWLGFQPALRGFA